MKDSDARRGDSRRAPSGVTLCNKDTTEAAPSAIAPYRVVVIRPLRFGTPLGTRAIGAIVATERGRHFEWGIRHENLFDPAKLRGGAGHPLHALGPGMLVHESFLRAVRAHGAERIILDLDGQRMETTVADWLGRGSPADLGSGAGPQLHMPLSAFAGGEAVLRRLEAAAHAAHAVSLFADGGGAP